MQGKGEEEVLKDVNVRVEGSKPQAPSAITIRMNSRGQREMVYTATGRLVPNGQVPPRKKWIMTGLDKDFRPVDP